MFFHMCLFLFLFLCGFHIDNNFYVVLAQSSNEEWTHKHVTPNQINTHTKKKKHTYYPQVSQNSILSHLDLTHCPHRPHHRPHASPLKSRVKNVIVSINKFLFACHCYFVKFFSKLVDSSSPT
jgi:hypothetical protein